MHKCTDIQWVPACTSHRQHALFHILQYFFLLYQLYFICYNSFLLCRTTVMPLICLFYFLVFTFFFRLEHFYWILWILSIAFHLLKIVNTFPVNIYIIRRPFGIQIESMKSNFRQFVAIQRRYWCSYLHWIFCNNLM